MNELSLKLWNFSKRIIGGISGFVAYGFISGLTVLLVLVGIMMMGGTSWEDIVAPVTVEEDGSVVRTNELGCNVLGIELRGFLAVSADDYTTYGTLSDQVLYSLDDASSYKAVLLDIDSVGGTPVAAEEIANAVRELPIPAVAWIRESGTSAAYWAATGADRIVASANSSVGSIGVTMSYLDFSEMNHISGNTYNQLSSGKFKDAGSPDKPLTAEERALFERDLDIIHENFVQAVARNRNIAVEAVRELADGSSVLGAKALEYHLIDRIGGRTEALDELQTLMGEEPSICWAGA